MANDIGIVFFAVGMIFLMIRFILYKFSNPFDTSTDKEVKHTPQMVIMLVLAEVFILFGVYFIVFPFSTITTQTATTYTALNVISNYTNTTITTITAPNYNSLNPDIIYLIGGIVSLIIVLLIMLDVSKVLAAAARSNLELK